MGPSIVKHDGENRVISTHMPPKLTPEIITAAITGFEAQKVRLDAQIAELRAMLSGGSAESTARPEPAKGNRRKMSAAARKRIGDAQRRRWAASKGQAESPADTVTTKPKRKLSAAGKAAIIAATKRRWALKRAEAAKAQSAGRRKTAADKTAVRKAAKKVAAKKQTATTSTLSAVQIAG
jgi:hypothetical protein